VLINEIKRKGENMSEKKKFICQECGESLESAGTKHTYIDCGEYHLKRAKEILDLAVVKGENKIKFINLMIQWNLGQIAGGKVTYEVWKLFINNIIPEWRKIVEVYTIPQIVESHSL